MKSMLLNLKSMKKIGGDEHSSTFKHDAGHEIKIFHGALPALQKEQIKRLPIQKFDQGGQVQKPPAQTNDQNNKGGYSKEDADKFAKSLDHGPDAWGNLKKAVGFADGGTVPPKDSQQSMISKEDADKFAKGIDHGPDAWGNLKKAVGFAEGGQAENSDADKSVTINIGGQPAMPSALINPNAGAMAQQPVDQPQVMTPAQQAVQTPPFGFTPENMAKMQQSMQPQQDQAPTPMPQVAPQPAADAPTQSSESQASGSLLDQNGSTVNVPGAFQSGERGMAANEHVQSALAEDSIDPLMKSQKAIQNRAFLDAQNVKDMAGHVMDFEKFIKGDASTPGHEINPNHYLENQSAGQKVATAIGLFLGGFSTPFTHQGNPAMQFLNEQISRDIDAQKANVGERQNVLGAYQHLYGDQVIASNLAKASRIDILDNQMKLAAARLGTPAAQAQYEMAHAQWGLDKAGLIQDAALRKSAFDQLKAPNDGTEQSHIQKMNALKMINPELFKMEQSKYIPSVGVARVPVSDKDRDELIKMTDFNGLIKHATDLQQKYGWSGAWSVEGRANANSLKQQLQVRLNDLTGLNRLNEHEYKNYGEQIGNIGGINGGGTLQGLRNMQTEMQSKLKTFNDQHGIVPFGSGAMQGGGGTPLYQPGSIVDVKGYGRMKIGPDGKTGTPI